MPTDDQPPSASPVPRPARAPMRLVCEVRQGQRPWFHVTLHNLSERGFCIDWQPAFEQDRLLWLRLPGLNLLQAHIRWKRGSQMGCEFETPLYGPVLDHIVRLAAQQR